MRRVRQLATAWPGWLILVALMLYSTVVSRSTVQLTYADNQTLFGQCKAKGTLQPVGIDFGFRLNVPNLFNEPRMYVSSPLTGKSRVLDQCDADATAFSLRATLPDRPNATIPFVDSIAVIPAVVGTQQGTTLGGFTPNDILVTQGLNVFKVSGAGTGSVTSTPLTTIPFGTASTQSQCTSPNSRIIVDRWRLQFGGRAILICTGATFSEIWQIGVSGTTLSVTKLLTSSPIPVVTGRFDLTSPNFSACGGCLALVADGSTNVTLINGAGVVSTIDISAFTSASTGANAVTVPPRVFGFGSFGGCLFGTVPSQDAIFAFPCTTQPAVFVNTSPGDLLIFTAAGAGTVVRVAASDRSVSQVSTTAGVYQDVAFPSFRLAGLVIQQPSVTNPNPGLLGNIVFFITSSPGFVPGTDVNVATIKFGRTGNEDSVKGNCKVTGEDVNRDGVPDLKCFADPTVANCNAPAICVVTGFTFNQTGFDGI